MSEVAVTWLPVTLRDSLSGTRPPSLARRPKAGTAPPKAPQSAVRPAEGLVRDPRRGGGVRPFPQAGVFGQRWGYREKEPRNTSPAAGLLGGRPGRPRGQPADEAERKMGSPSPSLRAAASPGGPTYLRRRFPERRGGRSSRGCNCFSSFRTARWLRVHRRRRHRAAGASKRERNGR